MELRGSIKHLQEHADLRYPQLHQFSPCPHPTSWRSILILSSHLSLGLPSGLFPSVFPTKTLHMPLLPPVSATCPAPLSLLSFINRTILGEEYRSLSSLVCSFLYSPVTSTLLGPIPSAIYFQQPSAYVPPSLGATKFHAHKKTTGIIIGPYILIFIFLDS
jgi:hypothetical protein